MPTGKVGSLSKPAFLYPMAAVGALAITFCIYYFAVTARQENALNQRALRALAAVADGFHGRVLNLATVVGQAGKKQNEPSQKVDFKSYLKQQAPDLVSENEQKKGAERCAPKDTAIEARLTREQWDIEFSCGGWLASLPIEKTVVPYLQGVPSQMFDEVLIADDKGAVLYQSLKTGILINNLSAIPIRNEAAAADPEAAKKSPAPQISELSQSTTVSDISIGGQNFKVYMMPIVFGYRIGMRDSDHMVAVGLILSERFRSESMALPGAALNAFGLSVLIIIFAAWPVLKFTFMRRSDRLPRRSPSYFFLSILVTTILSCVLAIHLRYVFATSDIDRNLENLSEAIDRNLSGELRRALRVMVSMDASGKVHKDIKDYDPKKPCGVNIPKGSAERLALPGDQKLLSKPGLQLTEYPYFDRVVFADDNGNQYLKWEVGSQATAATYVGDREYFRGAVNGDLWRLANDATAPPFRLDPVFSRNTGDYRSVISIKPRNAELCKGMKLPVMSMITPLLSLTNPVMPPDYGFALLDREGKVLFHSTSALSGRGNFLDDLDDPRDLRAAMLSGQEMNFWARYQGLGVRAHSTSLKRIEGNPWTLIVFHELAQSEAQNAERILLFAALAVAYLIIASAFVLSIPREPITTTWVWPSPTRKGEYLHVILVVVMIVPAFYSLIFKLEQATLILTAAVIIPTLTLTAAIFRLKKRNELVLAVSAILFVVTVFGQVTATPRPAIRMLFLISAILALLSLPHSERWLSQSKKPSTLNVLALLCSVMLMFAGILPCVAFFKVAYDYQASLLTRRWQIQTIEALATREDRVKEQYRSIPLANDKTSGSSEIGDEWLFLRRRLDETADRYDTVAFNLQDRTLSENSIANIRGECEQDVPPSLLATIAGRIPYGKGTVTHSFSQIKESVDGRWRWCREGNSRIRLEPNVQSSNENDSYYNLPATRAFVKATAGDSVFLYPTMVSELPRLGPSWIAAAITFLVAWWLAYKWVRPTLRLMFLEDEDDEDEEVEALPLVALQADTEFNADTILLTADPREASRYFKARPGTYVLDFVDVLRGTSVNYRLINQPLVVIDHFDYQIGTADADTKRLETLEGLRFAKPGGHLALLASTDPKFYFRESNPDAVIESARAVRWSRCLHNFNTVRQTPAESPTDDDYSLIWQASTPAEKAALDQLARDELANPQNWGALEQLQRRDLITGWPLRFKDEKFEKYVRKVASGPERRSWQQLDTSGVWEGIRMTAVVVVLGLLAAIFFFRQQTYLSYIATGLSILTPLSKLLSEARSLPLLLGFGGKKE